MTIKSTAMVAPYVSQALMEFDPVQEFIAARVARPIRSSNRTGTFAVIDRESTLPSSETLERADGAVYPRTDTKTSSFEYACSGYGLEEKLPIEQIADYAELFDAQMNSGRVIKGQLFADREERVEELIMNTTTFTVGKNTYKDYGAAAWSTAGTDVISQVAYAKTQLRINSGLKANAVIMSEAQRQNLLTVNTKILARLMATTQLATEETINNALASLLGVKYVIVGSALANSSKEGQDASNGEIWTDQFAMVCRIAETDAPSEQALARLMVWSDIADTDVRISTYYEEQTESQIVRGKLNETQLIVDEKAGFLLEVEA